MKSKLLSVVMIIGLTLVAITMVVLCSCCFLGGGYVINLFLNIGILPSIIIFIIAIIMMILLSFGLVSFVADHEEKI